MFGEPVVVWDCQPLVVMLNPAMLERDGLYVKCSIYRSSILIVCWVRLAASGVVTVTFLMVLPEPLRPKHRYVLVPLMSLMVKVTVFPLLGRAMSVTDASVATLLVRAYLRLGRLCPSMVTVTEPLMFVSGIAT